MADKIDLPEPDDLAIGKFAEESPDADTAAGAKGGNVAVFCGHMFNTGSEAERVLARRIADELEARDIAVGFGPLACGADIVIAEELLKRGAELNLVLPFAEDDFIAESVLCGGEAWLPRYKACREAAKTVSFATPADYVGDDNQFAYNTLYAMGLANANVRRCKSRLSQTNSPASRKPELPGPKRI